MSKKAEQFAALFEPALAAMGLDLWGCEWHSQGKHSVLKVFIEKQGGVTAEDCSEASRQISAILDVEDCIQNAYDLEVSSPGLSRPLYKPAHYAAYIGQKLQLTLTVPMVANRRQYSGVLESVSDEGMVLMVEGAPVNILFSNIDKAQLMFQFATGGKKK